MITVLVLALGVQNVGDVLHEGLVIHSLPCPMNIFEQGVFRHYLQESRPLIPSFLIDPFLSVEKVCSLKKSIEQHEIVSSRHVFR